MWNCGTSITISSKTPEKKAAGKHFGVFLILKTTFWMENLTQWWMQLGPFFQKSRFLKNHRFSINRFSKRPGEASPLPPSCVPVYVAEYTSISLNMPKYPWKCLIKLFWLCQGPEFTWSPYMFDRLLKMLWVLNMPGFWIWHDGICKGYAEFRICLIMAPYASTMPKYASVFLDVPQYTWTLLNIAECPCICLKMPEKTVFIMPDFSTCRDIVIITWLLL